MSARRPALLVGLGLLLAGSPLPSQQLGPSTGGMVAVDHATRFIGQHKRVLMIAAHPDDEDTELLTLLARGEGAEVAYLSLTRGEGGQNLIGGELGPGLGILRSEELLAARHLDGARQYFARAYDFGFSKSVDDTWRFWPRDSVLKDVVRVVRAFRPHVVVSIFSGTPRDGHGQHQAAGWATREAFDAAADPTRFPELAAEAGVAPWQPLRLYQSARFDTTGTTLILEGGVLDPAVGQSFLQIAMRGRSLHRSQDMGSPQRIGPSAVRLRLVAHHGSPPKPEGLFAGLDTTYAAFLEHPQDAIALQERLRRAAALRDRAGLVAGRARLAQLGARHTGPEVSGQLARIDALLFRLATVLCDATTEAERLIPGRSVAVTLQCWNASPEPRQVRFGLNPRPGLAVPAPVTETLAPGAVATRRFEIAVPDGLAPSTPYYLQSPRAGAWHRWDSPTVATLPFGPPLLEASVELQDGGRTTLEVVYRTVDQAIGEVRRPLFVTPRVSAALTPAVLLRPEADREAQAFRVRLHHWAPIPTTVEVQLAVPAGWAVPAPQRVTLQHPGETQDLVFRVTPPAGATGRHRVAVLLGTGDKAVAALDVQVVDYPHIRPRQQVVPAEAVLELTPLVRPATGAIAYVRGAADRIPEVLEALALPVTVLTGEALRVADLSHVGTVVIGPRAYETDPALALANERLLAFARAGGTVLVQYQQQAYFQGAFTPFALSLAGPGSPPGARVAAARVADETAPVRPLDAAHPALGAPHRITAADWDGWVQERGLYFPRQWGPEWVPLLDMADPGEPPQQGALLIAPVGQGRYVYTGLSFFRQLPAAVPGATRLFLNLLALGRQ